MFHEQEEVASFNGHEREINEIDRWVTCGLIRLISTQEMDASVIKPSCSLLDYYRIDEGYTYV